MDASAGLEVLGALRVSVGVVFGESLDVLRTLPSESAHCIVTSPPYWQQRDYGHSEQLGLESSPEAFVERLTTIMREARRVLRTDGTCWINLGDSYTGGRTGGMGKTRLTSGRNHEAAKVAAARIRARDGGTHRTAKGLKPKELVGIPWRVAFALQSDGWWLRSEVIWHKPSAMPECVRDRPSRDHEHVFLLTKSRHYYYDADAIRTPLRPKTLTAHGSPARTARTSDTLVRAANWARSSSAKRVAKRDPEGHIMGANARTVWSITQDRWFGAHTSTFPRALARRCILAGCPMGGLVLDPFVGTGTTLEVALQTSRRGLGIEINPEVGAEIERRLAWTQLGWW